MNTPLPSSTTPTLHTQPLPAEHQSQLRQTFAPLAAEHRRITRINNFLTFLAFLCILLYSVTHSLLPLVTFFLLLLVVALVGISLSPRLSCPACNADIHKGFGPHCPSCAAPSLRPPTFFRAPFCHSCHRHLRHGKHGRQFKIHACTHCGLWLDDPGL